MNFGGFKEILRDRDQKELLREMSSCKIKAMIIKIAAMGLHKVHLGHTTASDSSYEGAF